MARTARDAGVNRPRRRAGLAAATMSLGLTVSMLSTGCVVGAIPGVNCALSPNNSFWRADVTGLTMHASSTTWINQLGTNAPLKADFGAGLWAGAKIGIPYTVIPGAQPAVPVTIGYPDSDPGPYQIPSNPNIEGGGDKHVLLVDQDNCRLQELWNVTGNATSGWKAGSGAKFDLTSNAMRAAGATSADAAGLPILPGLVRYEEAAAGEIHHAIRITIPQTKNAFVWPASHQAGIAGNYPPMGSWLRLKSTVNAASFDPMLQPIIRALQTYGAVVADNGSAFFMSGAPDDRWDNDVLQGLSAIKGHDFEFVDAQPLKVASNSYEATTAH